VIPIELSPSDRPLHPVRVSGCLGRPARESIDPHQARRAWMLITPTIAVLALVIGYFASGMPYALSLPEVEGSGTVGGFRLSPEFGALLIALTLYTAAHIAEIVRGSILAVPRGQTEAAIAVGLS
jgi:general L-amino acid transport system permease protein